MIIIRHEDVETILTGREAELVDLVDHAYRLHDEGRTAVPHSAFLRFPESRRERIIALPAFVGDDEQVAGVKWVSSFPGNIGKGLPRAHAAIVLNSTETGRPEALIEGSLISAKRTAASAALAARVLLGGEFPRHLSLVGCGVINEEVLRFLAALRPHWPEVTLYDLDRERAAAFARRCAEIVPGTRVTVAADAAGALAAGTLISIATTVSQPHLDTAACRPGSLILHLSLRDLTPEAILAAQNVVDDPDHVCRELTSLHLAEQLSGDRRFVGASIGALLRAGGAYRRDPAKVTVFSPFGLGALDMVLARFVRAAARKEGRGLEIADFLPQSTDQERR
ncbi:2,3-diaminopropionate biosynthesis protein SbnB [Nonomuraea fuscirosea]|uniref:2,3-diaminopropionate biosynthesis protein SbnB n=1 Tax=Nonomuraea fuscirosea TaxID=1291556 RepID=UPI0034198866